MKCQNKNNEINNAIKFLEKSLLKGSESYKIYFAGNPKLENSITIILNYCKEEIKNGI